MKKVIAILAVVFCFTASTAMAQGGGQRMTPEERAARMKEQLKPLNLTEVQADSAVAIMTDRSYMQGINFREMAQEDMQAKMKEIQEARQKRLEKALGADLAKKVMEALPQRGPGGRGGGGGRPNGK
jgi:hypothetical protein